MPCDTSHDEVSTKQLVDRPKRDKAGRAANTRTRAEDVWHACKGSDRGVPWKYCAYIEKERPPYSSDAYNSGRAIAASTSDTQTSVFVCLRMGEVGMYT